MVDAEGGSSERCLKWGGGGSLRDLSKNVLKQGVGKGKSCSYGGGGFEGVTFPAPPPENFNHTPTTLSSRVRISNSLCFTQHFLLSFKNLMRF